MTPYTQGFWLFCGLGACVFAALAAKQKHVFLLITGFIAAMAWIWLERLPDPVWMEGLAVGIVILIFRRPTLIWLALVFGGILAGLLGSLLQSEGIGVVPAALGSVALLAVSAGFGIGRPKFAPAAIRDDALILVASVGLLLAVVPALSQGWQSAVALNVGERGSSAPPVPVWVLVIGGASLGLGGAYSVWRRS